MRSAKLSLPHQIGQVMRAATIGERGKIRK
jgi:hypothetical protein